MTGGNSAGKWIPLLRPRHRRGAFGIYSVDAFQGIIERERARSDRNSHGFSLAVFSTQKNSRQTERLDKLVRVLVARARFTDEVGWLGYDTVGVLLTETQAEGAQIFSDRVRWALSNPGPAPECHVYEYPGDGTGGRSGGGPEQLWFSQMADYREASPFAASAAVQHPPEEGDAPPPHAHARKSRASHDVTVSGTVEEAVDIYLAPRPPLWKRILDCTGSLIALIVFAPLMLLIALLIKVVSPGPVIFRQERIGFRGKKFQCFKFRTMHVNCDQRVHRSHLSSLIHSTVPMTKLETEGRDKRLIPLGGILRQCAFDELPQLINVLRGDMSLVGPRPCIPYEYEEYRRWQKRRVDAVPGMTGLWQVSGKNRTTFNEMMRLDIRYAKASSLLVDLMIAVKTLPAVVGQVRDGMGRKLTTSRNRRPKEIHYA